VVVLVNNSGWGIFRPVTSRQELLDLPVWPYAELAESWGGVGFRVSTSAELRAALKAAHRTESFVIVECILPKKDISPVSRRYIRQSARKSGASRGSTRQ
jgi:indolepyruvate decarboxylase